MNTPMRSLLLFLLTSPAYALSGFDAGPLEILGGNQMQGGLHELHSNTASPHTGTSPGGTALQHFGNQSLTLPQTLRDWFAERGGSPLLKLREKPRLSLQGSASETRDFEVMFGNYLVCDAQLRATVLRGGELAIAAHVPVSVETTGTVTDDNFPSLDDAAIRLTNDLAGKFPEIDPSGTVRVLKSQRCVILDDDAVTPSWRIELIVGDLLYRGLVSADAVRQAERQFFDVTTARISTFKENHTTALETVSITLKDGSHFLTSPSFETNPLGTSRADQADGEFVYDRNDPRFPEATAFAHIHKHLDFFKSLGFRYDVASPLLVTLHSSSNNMTNNALYTPALDGSRDRPEIRLGDGDGNVLQNLAIDGDVISHELGHHIVFQRLKSTQGQSLPIHEGLADFFVFARRESPCLAETICPAGAPDAAHHGACWVREKCLRTADNSLRIDTDRIPDSQLPMSSHLRGQVVSGLLWDLVRVGAFSAKQLAKVTYDAVGMLLNNSGYRDLLLALLTADSSLHAGQHCDRILNAAIARGFGTYLSDVACKDGGLPSIGSVGGGSGLASLPEAEEDENERRKFPSCGMVGEKSSKGGMLLFVIGLATPLAAAARRRGLRSMD